MKFMKVDTHSSFNIHDPIGIRLLTRLHVDFCQLKKDKSRYNFRHTMSPMCNCDSEIYSTEHFLLHCPIVAVK